MIELTLTKKLAKKIRAALNGPSVTDAALARVVEYLDHELALGTHVVRAPWRKVVGKTEVGMRVAEKLECGHSYVLKQSTNYIHEAHAKKRRCTVCADLTTARG